jgi:ribosome-associated translation inhibitor RaiA
MRIEIRFRHMPRSEALESLVTERVVQASDGFVNRHDAHIQVWLVSDLNRTTRGTGSFICEIEVRYPPRKEFFIQKESSDMHVAIHEATEKLQDYLNDTVKKESEHRRNAIITEIDGSEDETVAI